jgi:hypothetical protein
VRSGFSKIQLVVAGQLGAAGCSGHHEIPGGRSAAGLSFQTRSAAMSKVKHIASTAEIPAGQNYVLVEFGEISGEQKHSLGFTITVPRNASKTVSDLSFLAAVHSAKTIAKREDISAVFACK